MCARIYRALEDRYTIGEVDRLELWQAAVAMGRDRKQSTDSLLEQMQRNIARAEAERARPRRRDGVASRPSRIIARADVEGGAPSGVGGGATARPRSRARLDPR